MPLFYESEYHGHRIHFSHFLFSDIDSAYPFLQLSDLKNGVFDKVCKSFNFSLYCIFLLLFEHNYAIIMQRKE